MFLPVFHRGHNCTCVRRNKKAEEKRTRKADDKQFQELTQV